MFGLDSVEGEFSRLFNSIYLFDNKICTRKRSHVCHWSCLSFSELRGNMYYFWCFMFVYLFACFFGFFLHFSICNVWFVSAKNRFLIFIIIIIFVIITLKFVTTFFPVNIWKFVNSILFLIVNSILRSSYSGFFP